MVKRAGGRAHFVGGCVRDAMWGLAVDDLDIEVFGLSSERLRAVLDEAFRVDFVGESFGVFKLAGHQIDVALPRRERKSGSGHRGFDVSTDPEMGFAEAAKRRDYTINAIAWEPLREELIDPLQGVIDIDGRRLRHSSPRFVEDPLRVLRGVQFVARFGLTPVAETVGLCRGIELEGLARERIFGEWRKLLLLGRSISGGLAFLRETNWLRFFPELEALVGVQQDPRWHPEGDVWRHTLLVMDAFAADRIDDEWEDLVVGFACLCHDLGKATSTAWSDGRWRSPGHEQEGERPTRSFLERLTGQRRLIDQVLPLVLHHMKPQQLFQAGAGNAAVRRLARRVERIDRLIRVCRADAAGRPPLAADFPAGDWLLGKAQEMHVEAAAPQRLVLGRHLIERGLEPGPAFGPLLERCYEAQLDGEFADLEGGLSFLDRLLAEREDEGQGASGG